MSRELRDAFGTEGPLARILRGYVPRPQQIDMAETVEDVLISGGWAMIDAPTGVGKSLGYSIPVALSGARALILTSSINLQEQLVRKDLPLVQQAFPGISFALVLGQGNYACLRQVGEQEKAEEELATYVRALDPTARTGTDPRQRIMELARRGVPGAQAAVDQYGVEHSEELGRVMEWLQTSDSGCVGDAPWQISYEAWRVVNIGPGACRGSSCADRQECYMRRAWGRAYRSQIVVANYHLFFSAAARALSRGADMPFGEFDVVICDEAHKMPDIARQCLGFRISRRLVNYLCRFAPAESKKAVDEAARKMFAAAWASTDPEEGRKRMGSQRIYRAGWYDPTRLCEILSDVVSEYHEQAQKVEDESKAVLLGSTAERVVMMRDNLWAGARLAPRTQVYFVEGTEEWPSVSSAEIDVGPSLYAVLGGYPRVVLTSATLATGSSDPFAHIGYETGVDRAASPPRVVTRRVDSPFDHASRCVVWIPSLGDPGVVAPDTNGDAYREYVAQVCVDVVRIAGGRTLCLFTSWRGMEAARDALRSAVARGEIPDVPILVQNEDQRSTLVERFRIEELAVLLGVTSMWTGIDVPGKSCVAVVVDKIPFPNPREPVMEALGELDSKSFDHHSIPRAVADLRQGAGRLIRDADDFGVICLPDTRLVTKRYGREFLGALPRGMKVVRTLTAVETHLARFGIAASPYPQQKDDPWQRPNHAAPSSDMEMDDIPF